MDFPNTIRRTYDNHEIREIIFFFFVFSIFLFSFTEQGRADTFVISTRVALSQCSRPPGKSYANIGSSQFVRETLYNRRIATISMCLTEYFFFFFYRFSFFRGTPKKRCARSRPDQSDNRVDVPEKKNRKSIEIISRVLPPAFRSPRDPSYGINLPKSYAIRANNIRAKFVRNFPGAVTPRIPLRKY